MVTKRIGKPMTSLGQDRLRMLLHGEPGSGKTTKAASIAEVCRTLYVQVPGSPGTESISSALRKNMRFEKVQSYDDVAQLFWSLQMDDHNFEAIVFEGFDALQGLFLQEAKGYAAGGMQRTRGKAAPNTDARRLYGDVVPLICDTAVYWYGLADADRENPMNVIFTSQTRFRKKDIEDEEEVTKWHPDVSPGSWNAVESNPDFIGFCTREPDLDDPDPDSVVFTVRFQGTEQIVAKMHTPEARAKAITKKFPGAVFGRTGSNITIPSLAKAFGVQLK